VPTATRKETCLTLLCAVIEDASRNRGDGV
jgi:hypothetical protein